jgi:hypothetical protein
MIKVRFLVVCSGLRNIFLCFARTLGITLVPFAKHEREQFEPMVAVIQSKLDRKPSKG